MKRVLRVYKRTSMVHNDETGELSSNCSTILSSLTGKNMLWTLIFILVVQYLQSHWYNLNEVFRRFYTIMAICGTIICYCASFWLLAQTLAYILQGLLMLSGQESVLSWLVYFMGIFRPTAGPASHYRHDVDCAGVLVINLLSRSTPH